MKEHKMSILADCSWFLCVLVCEGLMAPGLKYGPYATMHYLMQPHVVSQHHLFWRVFGAHIQTDSNVPSPSYAFVLFTVVLKSQLGKQNRCLMRIIPPRRFSSGQIKGSKSLVSL